MFKVSVVLCLVASAFAAFGQAKVCAFELGLEAGPSIVSLRGSDFVNKHHKSSAGFYAAFSAQYNLGKVVSLRSNIAFERKGSYFPYSITDLNGNVIAESKTYYNYNYITIPFLLRVSLGNTARIFINAGPYVGALLNHSVVIRTNTRKYVDDNTENADNMDMGLAAGMGVSIPVKEKFLLNLEVRHNRGYFNVMMPEPDWPNFAMMTNATNCIVGVAYKLGKDR